MCCENGKLEQSLVLGFQGSDKSDRAVVNHAIERGERWENVTLSWSAVG